MGLRINQNIAAQNAYRNLSVTDGQMSKQLEKLSSGFRINRAADDAAGLSISEGLRSQVGGLKVATRNAQDAISVVQTAEGALSEVTSMVQRMRDLAVQANSSSLDAAAKGAAQKEFAQLGQEIDRIGQTTSFGKAKLLDGSFGTSNEAVGATKQTSVPATVTIDLSGIGGAGGKAINTGAINTAGKTASEATDLVNAAIETALKAQGLNGDEIRLSAEVHADGSGATYKLTGSTDFTVATAELGIAAAASTATTGNAGSFQVGANAGESLSIKIGEVSTAALGINTEDLTAAGGADKAIKALDVALQKISDQRANLGASQNRFEHTINNLNTTVENLSSSESRIRDADMAQEMVSFTRAQILTQAGTAMLSQANQASQGVMSLLR